jgi:hypothetical protein
VVINGAAAGKVLIVDDERLNVDVLSRDGYEVISAHCAEPVRPETVTIGR